MVLDLFTLSAFVCLITSVEELQSHVTKLYQYTFMVVLLAASLSNFEIYGIIILCRLEDVGKPKAEVAAKRVMERVTGVDITPHFCRIEDKPLDFYSDFAIIVLGLDSVEARSYINAVACGFLG